MPPDSSPGFDFADLRDAPSPEGFDAFVELYKATFTDESEREDPEDWRKRLAQDDAPPQPLTRLLLARRADDGELAGGLVFEFYRESGCGLLTYLVVAKRSREQGLARQLIDRAKAALAEDARRLGVRLNALFAESESPTEVAPGEGPISPRLRLSVFEKLGAKWLRFPYVQPELKGGKGRCRHLLLLTFPLPEQPDGALEGEAVAGFLDEFYRALGVEDPPGDPDMIAMSDHLSRALPLRPLSSMIPETMLEDPVLKLGRCSVCLHFLEEEGARSERLADAPYHYCQDMSSMELDLLSFAFQRPPTCNSECRTFGWERVEIHFPSAFVYNTEGRMIELICPSPVVSACVSVSQTRFVKSGRVIWHLAIRPDEESRFSEYDIIKLIHLYDGRAERTQLGERIQFRRAGRFSKIGIEELLRDLNGGFAAKLQAGTVQIITDGQTAGGRSHAALLNDASEARGDDAESDAKHAELMAYFKTLGDREAADPDNPGAVMRAYCGIVTGIFDFREVDGEEALDTLEPTFADESTFLRIHRCTLVSIGDLDRALEACWNRVGASPYLLLPHAALLHNEAMVNEADERLDEALKAINRSRSIWKRNAAASLTGLESALHAADRKLRFYLPNIFNYVTERELFSKGAAGRGLLDQREATEAKLVELRAVIESRWNIRRENGQMTIAMMLALVSFAEIKGTVFEEMDQRGITQPWPIYIAAAALAIAAIFALWKLGVRRLRSAIG